MSIKLGFVGGGGIGNVHIQAAKATGMELVCLADVNGDIASSVAKAEGIGHFTSNPQEMFESDDIEAVVIGVPNKFHAPLAIAAMKAGKDVLLEKPMALNVAECDAIIATAKETGRILQIGQVQRYSSVATTAKAFINAGRIGKVYHAKANYYRRRGIPGLGGWFTTKALSGGGPLIDLGVHIIDLMMYLMDFPKPTRVSGKVYANFGPRMKDYLYEGMWAGPPRLDGKFDVEDSAHALIRFEGGATLEVNTTWAGNFPDDSMSNVMGLFGDQGGMTFELGGSSVKLATEQDGHNVDIEPKLRGANPFEEQTKTFAGHVKDRTQPHASGDRGRVIQSLLDGIYASSEQDREVEL